MTDVELSGYVEEAVGSARVLVHEDHQVFLREALEWAGTLYEYAARHSEGCKIKGRSTAYLIPGPSSDRWFVRHLTHGGVFAPLTGDRFLTGGVPRPFNELRIAVKLAESGIATPTVLAAAVYPLGPFYRGDVARIWIEGARDLADCLFGEPELSESELKGVLVAVGRLIRVLQGVGVYHPDCNLRNILLEWSTGEPVAHILDLEKAELTERVVDRRRRAMLARLRRSLVKFEEINRRKPGDRVWETLLDSYYATGGRA